MLICFQLLSGLKINFQKNKLYSCGVGANLLQEGSGILQCSVGDWSLSYLGVTVGLSPKRKHLWDPLVRKFDSRLTSWKCSTLNMAGRLVLLNATLDSLPTYWLNLYALPGGVCQKIETIRRSFIWEEYKEDGENTRKLHLLKWDKMIQPRSCGGLNIVPLKHANQTLLAKWWFKWLSDRKAFWHELLKAKYDCYSSSSLGDALAGKNIFPILKGITDVNADNGFGRSLHFNQFQWTVKDGNFVLGRLLVRSGDAKFEIFKTVQLV